MNEIQTFSNIEFGEIRTIHVDDKPYFVGSDIAKVLGYKEPHKAVSRHCKGGMKRPIPTNGGNQEIIVIPEGRMMNVELKDNLVRVVILDVSGIYAQIHNQGYFNKVSLEDIKRQYSDKQHWRVVVLDN